MIILNERQLNKLDGKISKVVRKEYSYVSDGTYATIESLHYDRELDETTLHIRFGFTNADGEVNNHSVDISIVNKNLDFIAGQFLEAIVRENW